MKNLKLLFCALVVCLALGSVHSVYAKEEKKATFIYELTDDSGVVHTFTLNNVSFTTPSGNVLRSYKIRVPEETMKNISFGPFANKILGVRVSNIDGSGETVTAYGFLNKAGNLNFTVHSNGAGNSFPKGWY